MKMISIKVPKGVDVFEHRLFNIGDVEGTMEAIEYIIKESGYTDIYVKIY